ncbi:MAG TPA: bacteriohemerythrin [Bacteroidales bacterium]|nr:bacteriohemerythrin [Bacteroidales bacterium]
MELIQWTDNYLTGFKEIDNQHKGLVIIINELFTLMQQGKAKKHLDEIFDHLTDYTKKHFFEEEKMMIKYAFNEYNQHKEEHQRFIDQLAKLKSEFALNKVTISIETLNFLKQWLLNHILVTDMKYVPHIKRMEIKD